ncbi:serine C-palmitoyltransferase LCB1 [Ascoidea rubescens DSM 1968]|uniref:serine C-palmitoyltransferase n=1 Tax=Ascoidea rubescens DSM 1968 TaxID=1344418 RepID=A0A1D2VHM8_9ASCO|nr:PLP-dependent transferase [Ascoidea rubescens DSM 1968]ODV61164.1 PLP-dependent transferase [Ascoidea rubescens DSM 1968]
MNSTVVTSHSIILPEWTNDILFYSFEIFQKLLKLIESLPGGVILIRYIKSSYQNDPFRSILEIFLVLFALRYFISPKYSIEKQKNNLHLSKREIDDLCNEWVPEPLVDDLTPSEAYLLKNIPIVDGRISNKINLLENPYLSNSPHNNDIKYADNKQEFKGKISISDNLENVINLASNDFLNLNNNPYLKSEAAKVIRSRGVGACGPPGFYGTQDIHVRLENDLADYFGAEKAIIYGQDFCTAESIIPVFLKRGDYCLVDSGVNLSIQKAVIISRCKAIWFNHNDLNHLVQILEDLKDDLANQKNPIPRKFIITEGLFANTGDFPDLPKLVQIKNDYKFRLFIDESFSIGVLGKSGKGLCEHFNVDRKNVEITTGSMANSFASAGGFCIGEKPMVFYQRIASSAYCFSAALPPYLARTTSCSMEVISKSYRDQINSNGLKKSIVSKLQANCQLFHNALSNNSNILNFFKIVSTKESPVIHLVFNSDYKKILKLPNFYINENNKYAKLINEQLDELNEFNEPNKLNDKSGSNAAAIKSERIDYYSNPTFKKHHTLKEIQAELSPYDYYNIENFLIVKIVNKLLYDHHILVYASPRILRHEVIKMTPDLKINVHSNLDSTSIEDIINKLSQVILETCNNIKSFQDLKKIFDDENGISKY